MTSSRALAERADRLSPTGRGTLVAFLVFTVLAAIIVPTVYFIGSIVPHIHFFGEQSSPSDIQNSIEAAQLACLWGLLLSAVGIVLALALRQSVAVGFFVVVAAISICVGVIGSVQGLPHTDREVPEPPQRPSLCVEFSGGTNECPGG